MENPCTLENLPSRPQSDQKDDGKLKLMDAFIFLQMKLCPQKCLLFAHMNWTLGDTHEQLDKNLLSECPPQVTDSGNKEHSYIENSASMA